jgi:hypothetical protein
MLLSARGAAAYRGTAGAAPPAALAAALAPPAGAAPAPKPIDRSGAEHLRSDSVVT